MSKVTPFLMFNDQLEAAIAFYTATFPDSEIRSVARTGTDGPIASAEFVVGGQVFMGYNGGPYFSFSEGPRSEGPQRFTELIGDKDPRRVKAVMDAMMTMVKLDVTALERAHSEA